MSKPGTQGIGRVHVTATVDTLTLETLDRIADGANLSRGQVLDRAIAMLADAVRRDGGITVPATKITVRLK